MLAYSFNMRTFGVVALFLTSALALGLPPSYTISKLRNDISSIASTSIPSTTTTSSTLPTPVRATQVNQEDKRDDDGDLKEQAPKFAKRSIKCTVAKTAGCNSLDADPLYCPSDIRCKCSKEWTGIDCS